MPECGPRRLLAAGKGAGKLEGTNLNVATLMERVDAFVAEWMAAERAPAVQLAITDRSGLLARRAYGVSDLAAQQPLTDDHIFEFGSIGKSFTAIVCLQLAAEGKLDLHAPVTNYLPWFFVPSRYEPITVHHLLTHTAGIIGGSDFAPDPRYEVWALRESEASAPGVKARYSNAGYKLLGLMLENITGKTYAQLVTQRIFVPLGMTGAEGAITNDMRHRLAAGHVPMYGDRPWRPEHGHAPATWFETNTADGCLSASASDLAIYLRMLLNRGAYPGGRILSEESFALLVTPHTDFDEKMPYAYGLAVDETKGHRRVEHAGGMVGYVSEMVGDPEAGIGVVAFTNAMLNVGDVAGFVLNTFVAGLRGEDLPEPPKSPEIDFATYAGTYRSDDGNVTIVAAPDGLALQRGSESIALAPYSRGHGKDLFLANHPDFALHVVQFRRNDADEVVEFVHGPAWYRGERYSGPTTFDVPEAWRAYEGHYTSHNPWFSDERYFVSKGALWVSHGGGAPHELVADGDRFRPADDPEGPEWTSFDTIVDGVALQAVQPGGNALYRFFTP
jgi:CubicO group peptidase (beta-lactamase class C family)